MGGAKRIEKRAGKVNKGVASKLRKLDRSLDGFARRCVGPLEQRLVDPRSVTPLVRDAVGGTNSAWYHLQMKITAARAQVEWQELLCPSVSQARGVLLSHMQRRLCFATDGARSHLRHGRTHALRYGAGGGSTDYQSCEWDAQTSDQLHLRVQLQLCVHTPAILQMQAGAWKYICVLTVNQKEEEKQKKQQPKCKITISGCTRSKI